MEATQATTPNSTTTALDSNSQSQSTPVTETKTNSIQPLPTNLSNVSSAPKRDMFSVIMGEPAERPIPNSLFPDVNDEGQVTVATDDGYSFLFVGEREEWTVTDPNGNTTKIWGDPHVVESDGDKWDFKDQTTFLFGDNKVTVETSPAGNGQTYTKTVTIYNDSDRFTITDIDKNEPSVVDWAQDARTHDAALDDGDIYRYEGDGKGGTQFTLRDK